MSNDEPANGAPVIGPGAPAQDQPIPATTVTVISPGQLPQGTKLVSDYLTVTKNGRSLAVGVVYANAYTCAQGAAPSPTGR